MSTDKPHHRISRTIQAAHKEDRRAGRPDASHWLYIATKGSLCGVQVKMPDRDTVEINTLLKYIPIWSMLTASPGRQRHRTARTHATRVPMPHAYPCHTHDDASDASASTRLPCMWARALALCTCNACTCKTSLGTDSAFCYRPYAAPCFF